MSDQELEIEAELEEESEPGPPALEPEVAARRREALRFVRKWGDPVLRARAIEVDRFDDDLRSEVSRMGQLMEAALGVGLAATQVGVPHRVLVYRAVPDGPLQALVNPVIEWSSRDEETLEEGCLSLPSVLVDVERPLYIRVSARDEFGEEILVEASGFEARVIQHEVDHLDGVLILDRIPRSERKEAMRGLREALAATDE